MTLTLIRHGQTEWSEAGRHTGRTDLPLTAAGEQQARALRAALADARFALVLCSPRRRATRTAELAGLDDVQLDEDLAEWDYGDAEGRTTADMSAQLGRPWTVFTDGVTGGETLEQVGRRADSVLARVRPVLAAGGEVALVGHGHQLRILAARWLGLRPEAGAMLRLDAGTLSRLGTEHEVAAIDLWNATPGCAPAP